MYKLCITTKRALTTEEVFKSFPHLVILTVTKEVEYYDKRCYFRFGKSLDAIRNISVSGIRNIKKIELQMNAETYWKFENKNRVDMVDVDAFKGYNAIPVNYMQYSCVTLDLEQTEHTKDSIMVTFDWVVPAGNKELEKAVLLSNLGPINSPFPGRSDIKIIYYQGASTWTSSDDLRLTKGVTIRFNETKYTSDIIEISVFSNVKDETIAEIFDSPEIDGMYDSKKKMKRQILTNDFTVVSDDYIVFRCQNTKDNHNARELTETIEEHWPYTSIDLKKTVSEEETRKLRLSSLKKKKKWLNELFDSIENTKPVEHHVGSLDEALLTKIQFDEPENHKFKTIDQFVVKRAQP